MASSPVLLLIGLICLIGCGSLFTAVEASIWLTVPNSGPKCVSEQIQANMVVVVHYMCVEQDNYAFGYTLDVRVVSPLHNKELDKNKNMTHGQIAFTTSESGEYYACFSIHHDQSHHSLTGPAIVSIDWQIGMGTKDWDSIAKKEKIEGVELQIRKSKELASVIKGNQKYLYYRDAQLREMSEQTNKRVAQLGFISIGVSFVVSLTQVWHLKRFFLKKKLI